MFVLEKLPPYRQLFSSSFEGLKNFLFQIFLFHKKYRSRSTFDILITDYLNTHCAELMKVKYPAHKIQLQNKSTCVTLPGMALCSPVLVCTIESISSSLVRSGGIEGDLRRMCLKQKVLKFALNCLINWTVCHAFMKV